MIVGLLVSQIFNNQMLMVNNLTLEITGTLQTVFLTVSTSAHKEEIVLMSTEKPVTNFHASFYCASQFRKQERSNFVSP